MLAQVEPPRNDFHALATYLIHGKERPTHPDRVAWIFGQNLGTDDPMIAAKLMAATAELSKRCREPCYHMSINWHPDEQPSPETMQEIARKTLTLAGLAEHQALVMGHGDKPHAHLHMMINRVHPDTGKAWSTSHDYRRFDRIMKQLSEEFGFLYVPPHAFEPELTDNISRGPNSAATYAAERGANTDRPQWSRHASRSYGAQLSDHLDHATTWDDLEALVAEDGLVLEPKGKGLVVGNAASYTKLSALGLAITAKGLAKRFGPRRPRKPSRAAPKPKPPRKPARRNPWTVDAVDIARAIGSKDDLRAAIQEARGQRMTRLANAQLMVRLMAELMEKLKASTGLTPAKRKQPRRPTRARDKRTRGEYRKL